MLGRDNANFTNDSESISIAKKYACKNRKEFINKPQNFIAIEGKRCSEEQWSQNEVLEFADGSIYPHKRFSYW